MIIDKSVLKEAKVVLFGAGNNGRNYFDRLTNEGFSVAYFVDNNKNLAESKGIPVYEPEILLNEDKPRLKIIITPDYPIYQEIEDQLTEMGLAECIFVHHFIWCPRFNTLKFYKNYVTFCGFSYRFKESRNPQFPYLETAKETINNFMQKREEIIKELNSDEELNVAKPCKNCRHLKEQSVLFNDFKFYRVCITCSPSICQSKCIFCERINDTVYPDIDKIPIKVAEIIRYIEEDRKELLRDDHHMLVATGEITFTKHKDILLDAISDCNSNFVTNAFLFNTKIADSMEKNQSEVHVSLDSGTRETFALVKGWDKFDIVIENLRNYSNYGIVLIKYVAIPGINDSEKDIYGLMDVLRSLGLGGLYGGLFFDYYLARRSALYSIARFINAFSKSDLALIYFHSFSRQDIELIKQYYIPDRNSVYEQRNNHFREIYHEKFLKDYQGFRDYVLMYEIRELLKHFQENTRFIIVDASKNERVVKAFEQLGLPFDTMELSSINGACEPNSIFVIFEKDDFNDVKADMVSKGVSGKNILDLEGYLFSVEPTEIWLENRELNNMKGLTY